MDLRWSLKAAKETLLEKINQSNKKKKRTNGEDDSVQVEGVKIQLYGGKLVVKDGEKPSENLKDAIIELNEYSE